MAAEACFRAERRPIEERGPKATARNTSALRPAARRLSQAMRSPAKEASRRARPRDPSEAAWASKSMPDNAKEHASGRSGSLVVVATPIGNLGDLSKRA